MSTKRKFSDKYLIGTKVLGRGAYAEVKLGLVKGTEEKVAVKTINKRKMKIKDFDKVRKEVRILQSLKHDNIVKIYDAFSDTDYYYIVMEYASGGDLFQKIVNSEEEFSESKAKEIIKSIAEALKHCKDNGVIHRDIKPENILITAKGDIKIADFNLSKKISKEDINFSILETECGTPNYVAPEVLGHKPYDYKCDIWSVGVLMFILLSGGYVPFFPDDETAPNAKQMLLQRVKEGIWDFIPDHAWKSVSDEAKDLLKNMLVVNPDDRITYEGILSHKWIAPAGPLISHAEDFIINVSFLTAFKNRTDSLKAQQLVETAKMVWRAIGKFEEFMSPAYDMITQETDEFFSVDI